MSDLSKSLELHSSSQQLALIKSTQINKKTKKKVLDEDEFVKVRIT
jgi:hypothetical protein